MVVKKKMVKRPQQPFVEKPPHVITHKCASLIGSYTANVLVKGSIDPSEEAVEALRHSRIIAALRNVNGSNVEKVLRGRADTEDITAEDIASALNVRGYGAGVGEALVLLLGTLLPDAENFGMDDVVEVAEHAYGMLQIYVGLYRMDARAKRAKLRAGTTAKFCGRDAIGEWQTALKYGVKSQDLTAHAKWILCKFGSFKDFHDAFKNAVNGWEAASRFVLSTLVLSTCLHMPR